MDIWPQDTMVQMRRSRVLTELHSIWTVPLEMAQFEPIWFDSIIIQSLLLLLLAFVLIVCVCVCVP